MDWCPQLCIWALTFLTVFLAVVFGVYAGVCFTCRYMVNLIMELKNKGLI